MLWVSDVELHCYAAERVSKMKHLSSKGEEHEIKGGSFLNSVLDQSLASSLMFSTNCGFESLS